jgi:hypothetical protein
MYRRTYVDPVHLYKPRDSIFPIFSYTTGTFISKEEEEKINWATFSCPLTFEL